MAGRRVRPSTLCTGNGSLFRIRPLLVPVCLARSPIECLVRRPGSGCRRIPAVPGNGAAAAGLAQDADTSGWTESSSERARIHLSCRGWAAPRRCTPHRERGVDDPCRRLGPTTQKIYVEVTRHAGDGLLTFLWSKAEIIKDATTVHTMRGTGARADEPCRLRWVRTYGYMAVAVAVPRGSRMAGAHHREGSAFAGRARARQFHRTDRGPGSRIGSATGGQYGA